jgi:hypothetical protein
MINITDRLELLAGKAALHRTTTKAIATAIDALDRQAGPDTRPSALLIHGFGRFLGPQNRKNGTKFDTSFLDAALKFCTSTSQNTDIGSSYEILQSYARPAPLAGTAWPGIKRGLKLMLVEMWRQRAVLLPTVFSPGAHFPAHLFKHKLLEWIQGYETVAAVESRGDANTNRFVCYGTRLLFATDWQSPEDVSLNELASLHRAQILYKNGIGTSVIAGGSQMPFSLFAAQLLKSFPGKVSFNTQSLEKYSLWSLTKSIDRVSFEDFSKEKKIKPLKKDGPTKRGKKRAIDHAAIVAGAVTENTHDAILTAYRSLQLGRGKSIDWRDASLPTYPAREHVDLASIAPVWIDTFKAFLHHREHVKEYRSNAEVVASLGLLADYLFFYLPWWQQSFPQGKVALPGSPKEFSRYAFVARHTDVPLEDLPAPLLQLISLRRPSKDSTAVSVHHLTKYFEFVGTHFAEDENVAGRGFTSPINVELDAPRVKKKNKTTKEVIPKQVYGHLLFYCYAVEEFGQYLQGLALQSRLPWERGALRTAHAFSCSEFGHVPLVKYRGKEYVLERVPNLFNWGEREIAGDGTDEPSTVYMPHLTALRLLIASLETGLRCQSVQWLDKGSWNSLNADAPSDSYTYALLVNTDKTRVHAWTTYVVHRVRDLLLREQIFQDSFVDANRFGPVNYEGLESQPFDSIRPLFRGPDGAYPIGDQVYFSAWIKLMIDFGEFYRAATGEQHVRMVRLKSRLNPDGTPVIRSSDDKDAAPFCAISILPIHTPHACRATFATNRQGVLELSDVAELLGHRDVVVTAHYTKPSGQTLRDQLQESDAAIVADYSMFDASSDIHIRADRPESALVKSFSRDRKETMERFRFMGPVALWSTEDSKGEGDGQKLLMEGPMSRIRFRETHICPVGEECPSDIIEQIGAPRRCGACPLAMKCIDHLPAIAAKKNQLLERIKFQHKRRENLEGVGEPAAVLDEVWEDLGLDINELLGWQLSEEILLSLCKQEQENDARNNVLHVDRPDIVRRHLQKVTRSCNRTELVLQRIADSNAYPTLSTPQVQAAAGRLRRRLLAGRKVDEIETWTDDLEELRSTAQMLSTMLKASGKSMSEVAALADAPTSTPAEPVLLPRIEYGS